MMNSIPMRETDMPRARPLESFTGGITEECQPPKKPVNIHFDILRDRAETLEHLISLVEETFDCVLTQVGPDREDISNMETTKGNPSNCLLVEWLIAVCYSMDCSIMRINRLLERADVG